MQNDPEQLFDRFRRTGDPMYMASVYDRTATRVLYLAIQLVSDPVAAEDLVQSTFLTAIEKADTWDASRPLLAWLTGILTIEARRWKREQKRRPDPDRIVPPRETDGRHIAETQELLEALDRALERIPPLYRAVLVLRLKHGLEPAEIAVALGRTPGAVRVQHHRGLEMLRRFLPAGLTATAIGTLAPALGLARIRDTVIEKAIATPVKVAGSVSTASVGATLPWAKALVLAGITAGLAAGAFAWANADGERNGTRIDRRALAATPEKTRKPLGPRAVANQARGTSKASTVGAPVRDPASAPEGFPRDLITVPAGKTELGLTAEQLLATTSSLVKRQFDSERLVRILVRELGSETHELPTFYLGRHEVTNEQYAAFVDAEGSEVRFPFSWWLPEDREKHRRAYVDKFGGHKPFEPIEYWSEHYKDLEWSVPRGTERYPVTWVAWDDARRYCAWAGLRLPTEAEWQRAASGKTRRAYVFGDEWKPEWKKRLYVKDLPMDAPRPVGVAPAARSWCGADDLIAGVWEWTSSRFRMFDGYERASRELETLLKRASRSETVETPDFSDQELLLKGGSYRGFEEPALTFRIDNRFAVGPDAVAEDIGFRVAKSAIATRDTAVGWIAQLDGRELDLDALRGIESWQTRGEVILRHRWISIIPVQKLLDAKGNVAINPVGLAAKTLVAVLLTNDVLWIDHPGGQLLPPGIYAIEYHPKPIPGHRGFGGGGLQIRFVKRGPAARLVWSGSRWRPRRDYPPRSAWVPLRVGVRTLPATESELRRAATGFVFRGGPKLRGGAWRAVFELRFSPGRASRNEVWVGADR